MNIYTKLLVTCVVLLWIIFFTPASAFAQEYVLPYPGFMPGHSLYKISNIVDKLQEWWSFGDFTKFHYHLNAADKKLVEAKILFEYKQFLLASESLQIYEKHLKLANNYLSTAVANGKNISQNRRLFTSAILKHSEVLEKLKLNLPERFLWSPEKESSKMIEIRIILTDAINLGEKLSQTK